MESGTGKGGAGGGGGGGVDRYPVWMMAILMLVALSSFIDRVIVATLGPAIKAELGISDMQFGLLTGLAFALLYTSAGIPVARLADRYDRVKLLSIATTIWSIMTMLSGYATNFVQLLLLRLGVGIGESAANPCTISMISDRFPRHKRASALAVVMLVILVVPLMLLNRTQDDVVERGK